jgi:hypothetical protein
MPKGMTGPAIGLSLLSFLAVTGCRYASDAESSVIEQDFADVFRLHRTLRLGESVLDPIASVTDMTAWSGGVMLLDAIEGRVRKFDRDGLPVQTIARLGDGPGELRRPMAIAALPGGGIAVLNRVGSEVRVFDAEGMPAAVWPTGLGLATSIVATADGDLVVFGESIQRGPDAVTNIIHRFSSLSGEPLIRKGVAPPARGSWERTVRGMRGAILDDTVVVGLTASNLIAVSTLDSESDVRWYEVGSGWYRPWTWPVRDATPQDVDTWRRQQLWLNRVFKPGPGETVVEFAFPDAAERRAWFQYLSIDASGRQRVTTPVLEELFHVASGVFVSVTISDGGTWLREYRLIGDESSAVSRP